MLHVLRRGTDAKEYNIWRSFSLPRTYNAFIFPLVLTLAPAHETKALL